MVGVFTMVGTDGQSIAKTLFSKYKDTFDIVPGIQQGSLLQKELDDKTDVLLFFSFDIVNSSIYKANNYYRWSSVIDRILSDIRQRVREQIHLTRAEVWRILGDEVIFIIKIMDRDSIVDYVQSIYKVLIDYCRYIEKGELQEELANTDRLLDYSNLRDIISLQASAWIAAVVDKKLYSNWRLSAENVFEIIEENNNIKFYEFTGIDIDAGFRVSKKTRARRLALSFELAYLLSQDREINNKLHIITYASLKGVWNESVYPVTWYYDPALHNGEDFKESIPFDAKTNDPIYAELLGDRQFNKKMYDDTYIALRKVCKDRRLDSKIDRINDLIKRKGTRRTLYISDSKLELHLVALCYNSNKEILVVQRSGNRELANKWEFGCAKASLVREIKESIVSEYKEDFGIDIEVLTDNNRRDQQPVPLAVYSMEKNGDQHKGVIFLAKIIGGEITINKIKHQKYRLIKESEVETINEDEYVNDAKDSLKKAFKMINDIMQE